MDMDEVNTATEFTGLARLLQCSFSVLFEFSAFPKSVCARHRTRRHLIFLLLLASVFTRCLRNNSRSRTDREREKVSEKGKISERK